jgi:hypothetical protein
MEVKLNTFDPLKIIMKFNIYKIKDILYYRISIYIYFMSTKKLKESLIRIAENIKDDTTLEDVYKQLSYLSDIEESENQVRNGEILTQEEIEKSSKKWLK